MTSYFPASRLAVERQGDIVFLARLPDGPIIVLEDIAAAIWTEACSIDGGVVADRVAARMGRDAAEIAPVVERFIDELIDRGLLREQL